MSRKIVKCSKYCFDIRVTWWFCIRRSRVRKWNRELEGRVRKWNWECDNTAWVLRWFVLEHALEAIIKDIYLYWSKCIKWHANMLPIYIKMCLFSFIWLYTILIQTTIVLQIWHFWYDIYYIVSHLCTVNWILYAPTKGQ